MVKISGDVPARAKRFIKYEIQRMKGRSNYTWRLIDTVEGDDIFTYSFQLANKKGAKKNVRQVSVSVTKKYLGVL